MTILEEKQKTEHGKCQMRFEQKSTDLDAKTRELDNMSQRVDGLIRDVQTFCAELTGEEKKSEISFDAFFDLQKVLTSNFYDDGTCPSSRVNVAVKARENAGAKNASLTADLDRVKADLLKSREECKDSAKALVVKEAEKIDLLADSIRLSTRL